MKKRLVAVIMLVVFSMGMLTGCGDDSSFKRAVDNAFGDSEIKYEANTRFMYSQDGGSSWSETIQEIPVNKTYYLAVEMQVAQSENTKDEKIVVATITIPSTNVLDCYLDDHPGVSITGREDSVKNCVYYDFDIVAGVSPTKFRVVFECKPLAEGRATVEVVYDDTVGSQWDATGTIKYVAEEVDASANNEIETTTAPEDSTEATKGGED